jgi:3-oxoacyl-ACP reductase-like protein
MGIFDKIKGAIWGEAKAAEAAPAPSQTTAATANPAPAPTPAPSATTAATSPATSAPSAPVDIASILDAAVKKSGQKLDWKHSIVDLMKALGMDASLSERKELAQELGYTGDTGDSAKMNTFLHKALLKKLADNGGKVPADLLD